MVSTESWRGYVKHNKLFFINTAQYTFIKVHLKRNIKQHKKCLKY